MIIMQNCGVKIRIVFTLLLGFGTGHLAQTAAEESQPYRSQEYIDTMVQNAYYGFLSSSESLSAESRQVVAINHAKTVASKLKRMAQGDPNRRYILWRVSELEHQIFLEEEEIVLKKIYKMQIEINTLCDKFNAEIGKARPSFVNLIVIHEQMLDIDPSKADELGRLIESRRRNISRETSYSLERMLLALNYERAKEEFEYIRKNRKYLLINNATYMAFEKSIRAKQDADDMVANFGSYLHDIERVIALHDCLNARLHIKSLNDRLEGVRTLLPSEQYSAFSRRIQKHTDALEVFEDSLVMENLERVHAGKTDEAIDYMDNVLRKYRISNDKILMVDMAIMKMPGVQRRTMADNTVDQEMRSFTTSSGSEGGLSFSGIEEKMRVKRDSVRAYQAEQARLAEKAYKKTHRKENKGKERQEKKQKRYQAKAQKEIQALYALLEQNKSARATARFTDKRTFLEQYASREEFDGLESALAQAREPQRTVAEAPDKNRQKAQRVTEEIMALLDNKEVERAWSTFQNLRSPLQRYSDPQAFIRLEQRVTSAYAVVQENRQQATTAKPTAPGPEVKRVASNTAPVYRTGPDTENAYAEFDKMQKAAQNIATQDVVTIYNLLGQNMTDQAYQYFRQKQIPLKKYICKEAYDILESSVIGAYNAVSETLH